MSDKVWWVVKSGDVDDLSEIMSKEKINVNIKNDQGRSLAHVAADYNFVDILKFLKSKGAQLDTKDKHGITPLLCAIWEGHKTSVEYLLSVGADPRGKTPEGQSYVDAAENAEIKQLLKAKLG